MITGSYNEYQIHSAHVLQEGMLSGPSSLTRGSLSYLKLHPLSKICAVTNLRYSHHIWCSWMDGSVIANWFRERSVTFLVALMFVLIGSAFHSQPVQAQAGLLLGYALANSGCSYVEAVIYFTLIVIYLGQCHAFFVSRGADSTLRTRIRNHVYR